MTAESRSFCPECGDPVPADAERGQAGTRRERSLCDGCYFDRFDLVDAPDRVEVDVCATCGAVRRDRHWEDVGARDYVDVAVDAVADSLGIHADAEEVSWQVDPEQVDETSVRVHCQFTGTVRGTALSETATVPAKLSRGTCTRCGRIAGDYYASVVQVRAAGRTPDAEERERAEEIARDLVAEHESDGDREAFVADVIETDDGVDVKLSTNGLGRAVSNRLIRQFGGTVEESETLVTEDEDGDEVYRVTYAVRLPRFPPGDVFDPKDGDGPVLVRSVTGNLKGVRLATGDSYEADEPPADARRLGERADGVETTVVAVEDEHAVQILDPETYEATTVSRPSYMDPDADSVPALRSRAGLHVLPDE